VNVQRSTVNAQRSRSGEAQATESVDDFIHAERLFGRCRPLLRSGEITRNLADSQSRPATKTLLQRIPLAARQAAATPEETWWQIGAKR